MVFLIHPLPTDHDRQPSKTLSDPVQTDDLRVGELVEAWGHRFQWTQHSLPHSELDRYARVADPVVDSWIESLGADELAHRDTLTALSTAAERGDAEALACWNEVVRPAPEGISVDAEEWAIGSDYFWENSGLIFTSLLHFSLAGGFSAPRITRQLHAASYLIPPVDKTGLAYCPMTDASRERTRGRLAETGQFVLDVMGCPLNIPKNATEKEKHYVATRLSIGPKSLSPPAPGTFVLAGSGEAWQASVRVRLLHAVARRRVAQKLARSTGEGKDDVALNQEDMIGTLASFAVAPLWCLERLGAVGPVLTADAEGAGRRSYIRLWRHIGFHLGVPEDVLRSHFSSYLPAGSLLASVIVDLFPPSGAPPPSAGLSAAPVTAYDDEPPSACPVFNGPHPTLPPPTLPVLTAITDQPPIRTSLAHHEGLTRVLVGDAMADYLGLSRGTWKTRAKLQLSVFLLVYPAWFANWYPSPRWRSLRREVIKEALGRMLKMQLSLRRSLFRPRDADGHLSAAAREEETVSRDLEGAKRLGKRYWAMIGEMVAVTVGVGVLAVVASISSSRALLRFVI